MNESINHAILSSPFVSLITPFGRFLSFMYINNLLSPHILKISHMWIHPELVKTIYTYLPLSPQGSARPLRRGAPCQCLEEEKNAWLAILLLHFTIVLAIPSLQPRILEIKLRISSFSIIASSQPIGPHCIGGDSELPQLQRPQNRYS